MRVHLFHAAAFTVLSALAVTPVLAAGGHGDRSGADDGHATMNMRMDRMMGMMRQMMERQGGDAQGGMMGMGPTGNSGDMGRMKPMMRKMMQSHHGGSMGGFMGAGGGHMAGRFDANDDGQTTPDELRAGLLGELNTYDADADGVLSLAEFETMHMAHIREKTVDRFQVFDADGDGRVTADEITQPAERMALKMRRTATPDAEGAEHQKHHDNQ